MFFCFVFKVKWSTFKTENLLFNIVYVEKIDRITKKKNPFAIVDKIIDVNKNRARGVSCN